jgi:vanillate O-demethylase monooxygenase subunit
MIFHHNTWYAAARAADLDRTLQGRTVAGVHVLIYRKQDGTIAAISNICPHRFAPLDRGTLVGDTVQCKYHGLEFGSDGRCVHNPHTDRIDAKMHIRSFPVVERYGYAWIWLGEPTLADPSRIPDLSAFEDGERSHSVHSYLDADYRYDILVDNLMDLSHADYLHVGSFSVGAAEKTTIEVSEDNDQVIVERLQLRCPAPPFARSDADVVDMRTIIQWHPGQVITFTIDTAPVGQPFSGNGSITFYHIATPADPARTHYFMGLRASGPRNPETDETMRLTQVGVIENEDGPMLQAIDRIMEGRDLMAMHPLVLPVDKGALRVRRVMKRLVSAETRAGNRARAELNEN